LSCSSEVPGCPHLNLADVVQQKAEPAPRNDENHQTLHMGTHLKLIVMKASIFEMAVKLADRIFLRKRTEFSYFTMKE